MSKVFIVNAGSSSLKFSIFEISNEEVIASGIVERIGIPDSIITVKFNGEKHTETKDIHDHTEAIEEVLAKTKDLHIIEDFDEIVASGHRVVAGGEHFKSSALLDENEIQEIEKISEFAPLHNPAEAKVIRAFIDLLPGRPAVAAFDTSFHTTMDPVSYLYALPYDYYTKYRARRYGAHGTSHNYVSKRYAELTGKSLEGLKLITAHIGNGGSITAIKDGKSVDTSMGFTPLAGIAMGTRSGDVDPSLLSYIMEKENLNMTEMVDILNHQSGIYGISGVSSDMRDVEKAANEGNERAQLAWDIYVQRVVQYIGQYVAEMNGVDGIIFTAGVGENSFTFRSAVLKRLTFLGIELDEERNKTTKEGRIVTDQSKVDAFVIPTDEELMILRDTVRLGKLK